VEGTFLSLAYLVSNPLNIARTSLGGGAFLSLVSLVFNPLKSFRGAFVNSYLIMVKITANTDLICASRFFT